MLEAVATNKIEFGTLSVVAPPTMTITISTAPLRDFNSVVEKPISRITTVEHEFTTPFGIAAAKTEIKPRVSFGSFSATRAWLRTYASCLMPVSFDATHLTAMSLYLARSWRYLTFLSENTSSRPSRYSCTLHIKSTPHSTRASKHTL